MAKAISIYLQDKTLAQLDKQVARQTKLDKLAGKTGHQVASRSSIIEEYVKAGLALLCPLTLEEITYAVIPLAEEYGAEKVSLFGSYARGEETSQSDVDILLEKGSIHGLQVLDFQDALAQRLGRPVDVVTTEGASERFLSRIAPDAVTLYERKVG